MGWVVVLLLVVLTGCGGPRRAAHTATVPTEPPPTTVVDPYAVPPVIDVDYINRVLAALDHVYGDALRALVRDRAVTPEFTALMASIYSEDQLKLVLDLAAHEANSAFVNTLRHPGDPRTSAQQVLMASASCIFVRAHRDLTAVGIPGPPEPQRYVGLRSAPRSGPNPTPWKMVADGFTPDGSPMRSPCTAA